LYLHFLGSFVRTGSPMHVGMLTEAVVVFSVLLCYYIRCCTMCTVSLRPYIRSQRVGFMDAFLQLSCVVSLHVQV